MPPRLRNGVALQGDTPLIRLRNGIALQGDVPVQGARLPRDKSGSCFVHVPK